MRGALRIVVVVAVVCCSGCPLFVDYETRLATDAGAPRADAGHDMQPPSDASGDAAVVPVLPDATLDAGDVADGSMGACPDDTVTIRDRCVPEIPGLRELAERCADAGTPLPLPGKSVEAGPGFGLDIAERPARNQTVEIDSAPMVLDQPNTRYVLTQDVTVDGWAFEIAADFVTLDLAGHTVTYGAADADDPGDVHGVRVTRSATTNVAIIDGTLAKGPGACDGSEFGGCAAVYFGAFMRETAEVAGLTIRVRGTSVSAIQAGLNGVPLHAHHVLIEDTTTAGSETAAHAAILHSGLAKARIHDNHIVGASHVGIRAGSADIHDNVIELDTETNNFTGAIRLIQARDDYAIYDNEIIAHGVSPVGLFLDDEIGTGSIHSNYLVAETTAGDQNRPARGVLVRPPDLSGASLRCNWMELVAGTNPGELGNSPTWGTRSWGTAAVLGSGIEVQDNLLRARDESGLSHAFAVAFNDARTATNVAITGNVIVATNTHMWMGATSSDTTGHTVVARNTFVRELDHSRYRFLRHEGSRSARATIVDNVTTAGVSYDDFEIDFCDGQIDLGFGEGAEPTYWLTNDDQRVTQAGSSTPEGACGFRVPGE